MAKGDAQQQNRRWEQLELIGCGSALPRSDPHVVEARPLERGFGLEEDRPSGQSAGVRPLASSVRHGMDVAERQTLATHALTLVQPWAYAVEQLGKLIENRGWAPPRWVIGKRIYIHAGMKCDRDSCETLRDAGYVLPIELARRSIGSSVVVRGWVGPDGQRGGAIDAGMVDAVLNDPWYVPGQVAWVLDDLQLLAQRIELAGQLGLWRVQLRSAAGQMVSA